MANQSRRSFLKKTTALAGGLTLTSSLAANGYAAGSDLIKIGLIGCGQRGTGAAVQALNSGQHVQLVAVADAFKDCIVAGLKKMKTQLLEKGLAESMVSVPKEHQFIGFDAYKDVIALCDVVIIATPPGFRPLHFEAAVAADKHVFMEKPVAVDAPGVRRVMKAAAEGRRKKLNVVVGLQRHYQEKYTTWVEMLQNGVIGDIVTSYVYWNSSGVWVRPRKPGQTEMEYQMRNWYYFNWLCGDHITEQHIHNLDVSNWVKQAYPIQASGFGGRRMRNGKDHGEIFDHHFVEYIYADGSRMVSQCRHWEGSAVQVTEAFQGTNGIAPKPGQIITRNGYALLDYNDLRDPDPYQVEHTKLFQAVALNNYRFADAENAAMSTMTAILGRMATYSGQVIQWSNALNSELNLAPTAYSFDANPPVMPREDGFYPVAIPGETKVM